MPQEQEASFVPYKFHDLKTYGSTEWLADGKKKYRQVFEASEAGYIYCELSFYNKLLDQKDWSAKLSFKCFEVNANLVKVEELCSIDGELVVKQSEAIGFVREGWGSEVLGEFWREGRFMWEVSMDEVVVGTRYFYVEAYGPVTAKRNPYFKGAVLRLFEGPLDLLPERERKYSVEYIAEDTRYVWGELQLDNVGSNRDWYCELVFNFFNAAYQLKGSTTELVLVRRGNGSIQVCSGWGANTEGTWHDDRYTLVVVFMGHVVSARSFEVRSRHSEVPKGRWKKLPIIGRLFK